MVDEGEEEEVAVVMVRKKEGPFLATGVVLLRAIGVAVGVGRMAIEIGEGANTTDSGFSHAIKIEPTLTKSKANSDCPKERGQFGPPRTHVMEVYCQIKALDNKMKMDKQVAFVRTIRYW